MRLPKEFRFDGCEVRITKAGDRVILAPLSPDATILWALIDQMGARPFMPEGREQPEMPEDRMVFDE